LFLDRFGPRWTTLLGAVLFATGLLLLGLSDSRELDLYIPGFALLCAGGPCIYFAALVMGARLWPERPATITAVLTSANDTSTGVFLVFEVINLYTNLDSSTFFFIYLVAPLLVFLLALLLWPDADDAEAHPVAAARERRASMESARESARLSLDERFEHASSSLRMSPVRRAPTFGDVSPPAEQKRERVKIKKKKLRASQSDTPEKQHSTGSDGKKTKKKKGHKSDDENDAAVDDDGDDDETKHDGIRRRSSHGHKKKKKSSKSEKEASPGRKKEVSFHIDFAKLDSAEQSLESKPAHLV
jgi:hypothetical protein